MTYRPTTWNSFIGQTALKRRLEYAIISALERNENLPPTLLLGPPGTGKTSLARLIAGLMGASFEDVIAPIPPRRLEMTVATHNGVFFIDELHRASPRDQERLLPLVEDGYLQDSRGRTIQAPNLSIIAATTEGDKVITPLYDRFLIKPPFEPYSESEMQEIVTQMASRASLSVTPEWAQGVAAASLGTPRRARSIIQMARDLMVAHGRMYPVERVLHEAGITSHGLDRNHQTYLTSLLQAGGSAGLSTMAQLLSIPPGQIEKLEVDLIKLGFLSRTPSGRELTSTGFTLAQELNV